jgi:hypothetical protein
MSATIKKPVTYQSTDEVLQEIWRIKDALSAARGHSVDKLFADARKRQKASGHRIVNLSKSKKLSRRKAVAA